MYKYDDSKAKIKERETGYVASCECGWKSEPKISKEEAVIAFEDHVQSDPSHKVMKEEGGSGKSWSSIFIAVLGIIYIISPVDLIPDYWVLVGWFEDILIGLLSFLFIKKGLEGESPGEILSGIFG